MVTAAATASTEIDRSEGASSSSKEIELSILPWVDDVGFEEDTGLLGFTGADGVGFFGAALGVFWAEPAATLGVGAAGFFGAAGEGATGFGWAGPACA